MELKLEDRLNPKDALDEKFILLREGVKAETREKRKEFTINLVDYLEHLRYVVWHDRSKSQHYFGSVNCCARHNCLDITEFAVFYEHMTHPILYKTKRLK